MIKIEAVYDEKYDYHKMVFNKRIQELITESKCNTDGKALVLDSKHLRSTKMLRSIGFAKNNITLAQRDATIAKEFIDRGYDCVCGDIADTFPNPKSSQFNCMILDAEWEPRRAWKFMKSMILSRSISMDTFFALTISKRTRNIFDNKECEILKKDYGIDRSTISVGTPGMAKAQCKCVLYLIDYLAKELGLEMINLDMYDYLKPTKALYDKAKAECNNISYSKQKFIGRNVRTYYFMIRRKSE
jgi:hypothetical protein